MRSITDWLLFASAHQEPVPSQVTAAGSCAQATRPRTTPRGTPREQIGEHRVWTGTEWDVCGGPYILLSDQRSTVAFRTMHSSSYLDRSISSANCLKPLRGVATSEAERALQVMWTSRRLFGQVTCWQWSLGAYVDTLRTEMREAQPDEVISAY